MYIANIIFSAPSYPYMMGVLLFPVTFFSLCLEIALVVYVGRCSSRFLKIACAVVLANLASALIGVLLNCLPGLPSGLTIRDGALVMGPDFNVIADVAIGVAFLLSSIIEGSVYTILRRIPSFTIERPWLSSVSANSVSYVIIMLITLMERWH